MKGRKRTFPHDFIRNDIKTAPWMDADMTLFVVELYVETCPEMHDA
jgi:hypothetical protein